MKKIWKWIAGAVVALAILGIAVFQLLQPLDLELIEIQKTTIATTFTEEGLVVAGTELPVSSATGGNIVRLPVKEGQTVKKGELLIAFDSTELTFQADGLRAQIKSTSGDAVRALEEPYSTELAKQEALLEQAKRNRNAAKTNFDRVDTLYQSGIASQAEYDQALNTLEDAENMVTIENAALEALKTRHNPNSGTGQYYAGLRESLEAQLAHTQYLIDQCSIKAPFDGIVALVSAKEGEIAAPNTPLMTLLQKNLVKVDVYVLTEDVDDLDVGDKVTIIQDKVYQDITFSGIVAQIAPTAVEKISTLGLQEQRVKVTVLPELPDNLVLRPGYALDVEFETASEDNRLVVPKTAIFPYQEGNAVWVVRKGRAEIQSIKQGMENENEVAVIEGLQEGDLVVLDPQAEGLKEGKRVRRKR